MLSVGTVTQGSRIAVIANRAGLDSQALLARAVAGWRKAGAQVAGVLAQDNAQQGMCSAGFLRDIGSGRSYPVHLDAPPAGTACHLDAAGMEAACAWLLDQIASADVVVFSKFGKLEAAGQGLWPAFAAAFAAEKPLLTTVSPKHRDAWTRLAPAPAWIEADDAAITQWWRAARPGGCDAGQPKVKA